MTDRDPTPEPDDDDTVIVGGASDTDDDDDTVIIDAEPVAETAAPVPDEVVLDGPSPDEVVLDGEATVRVDRSGSDTATVRVARRVSSLARPTMAPQSPRERGELRPAPVPSGFGGMPLVASGPGAISSYHARSLVPPVELAAVAAPRMPERAFGAAESVREQSRRASVWTAGAVAFSIVAITAATLWLVKDLAGL